MVYPIFNFTYQGIYREPRFLQLWCAALDISHGSDATGSLILNCSIPFLYFFFNRVFGRHKNKGAGFSTTNFDLSAS